MKGDTYRDLLDKVGQCDRCGQCEEKCPFDLPVRDLVELSRDILAGLFG